MSYETFTSSQLYKRKSINLSKIGFIYENDHREEYFKIQRLLNKEYQIKCESMLTIMKNFQIPSSRTMDILFRLFDIEARSFTDASNNALIQNRTHIRNSFNSSQQWHKTWEGKDVYLRSSYELNFAKHLDEQRIKYDTECMRILYFDTTTGKNKVAIPDFYLPASNTIVEIKSTYWLDETNMKDKSKEYQNLGFNFQLIVDGKLVEAERIELS